MRNEKSKVLREIRKHKCSCKKRASAMINSEYLCMKCFKIEKENSRKLRAEGIEDVVKKTKTEKVLKKGFEQIKIVRAMRWLINKFKLQNKVQE